MNIPDACPTCGAPKSHDTLGLLIRGCVYQCGAAYASDASDHVYPALVCRKALTVIAQLRADNVRLGDRNVLMAIAMQAAIEALEQSLRGWQAVPLEDLPTVGLLTLSPLRAAYDELVDALEGEPRPSTAAGVALDEPAKAVPVLSVTAAEHVHSGGVS